MWNARRCSNNKIYSKISPLTDLFSFTYSSPPHNHPIPTEILREEYLRRQFYRRSHWCISRTDTQLKKNERKIFKRKKDAPWKSLEREIERERGKREEKEASFQFSAATDYYFSRKNEYLKSSDAIS